MVKDMLSRAFVKTQEIPFYDTSNLMATLMPEPLRRPAIADLGVLPPGEVNWPNTSWPGGLPGAPMPPVLNPGFISWSAAGSGLIFPYSGNWASIPSQVVDVTWNLTYDAGASQQIVGCGFAAGLPGSAPTGTSVGGDQAYVVAAYDQSSENLQFYVYTDAFGLYTFPFNGNATFPGGSIPRAATMRFICVLLADGVSAYLQRIGTDVTPIYLDSITTHDVNGGAFGSWDPRPTNWGNGSWRPCVAISQVGSTVTQSVTSFTAGTCGGVGIRDIKLVTDLSAYPAYIWPSMSESVVTLSASVLSPKGLAQNAFLTYDLATPAVPPVFVTVMWVNRVAEGALVIAGKTGVWNDLATHLVQLERDQWWIFTSTWANGFGAPLNILWRDFSFPATKFVAGVPMVVGNWGPVALTTYPGGQYDPFLHKIPGGSMVMCYATTPDTLFPNSPMVVACDVFQQNRWVNVGVGRVGEEGAIVIPTANSVYLTGARVTNFSYYQIASSTTTTPTFQLRGEGNIVTTGGTDTRPWGNVFRLASDPDTLFLITFDDTRAENVNFTWGTMQLYVAA